MDMKSIRGLRGLKETASPVKSSRIIHDEHPQQIKSIKKSSSVSYLPELPKTASKQESVAFRARYQMPEVVDEKMISRFENGLLQIRQSPYKKPSYAKKLQSLSRRSSSVATLDVSKMSLQSQQDPNHSQSLQ